MRLFFMGIIWYLLNKPNLCWIEIITCNLFLRFGIQQTEVVRDLAGKNLGVIKNVIK